MFKIFFTQKNITEKAARRSSINRKKASATATQKAARRSSINRREHREKTQLPHPIQQANEELKRPQTSFDDSSCNFYSKWDALLGEQGISPCSFERGEYLINLDEEITEESPIYMILSGKVGIVVEGRELTTRENTYIGENAAVGDRRAASVIAKCNVECARMNRHTFLTSDFMRRVRAQRNAHHLPVAHSTPMEVTRDNNKHTSSRSLPRKMSGMKKKNQSNINGSCRARSLSAGTATMTARRASWARRNSTEGQKLDPSQLGQHAQRSLVLDNAYSHHQQRILKSTKPTN
jgi:CRP-like cAMP-binding protein